MINIGNINITGDLALAPLDGFSDHPFRKICKEMGAALVFTEFINSLDVAQKLNDLEKRVFFSKSQHPIGFQVYGNDPQRIVYAAILLQEYKPDFIDLNLGCAVRRVVARGAGAALLKTPEKIRQIATSLVNTLDVPVSAKMRLGWESGTENYLEIAQLLEDCGISMLSVHARYRDENYQEAAHWETIRQIKSKISIPVIGNGDIFSLEDILRMKSETNCDGVMVGRGAIGNPWIFLGKRKSEIKKGDFLEVIIRHWQFSSDFYGYEKAQFLFRKHLKAYLLDSQFDELDLNQIIRIENPIEKILGALKSL